MSVKEKIINYAKSVGVDKVGFTTAEPFLAEREILLERKELGLFSPFEENDVELRCHPNKLLPGARTIICFAMGYLIEQSACTVKVNAEEPSGIISRYASIKDYHRVMGEKLRLVADYIFSNWGGNFRIFVDTGSLMDRAAAGRAGLGWIGQNTCLFTEEFGSWVFLGEIITDLEVEPDEPSVNRCNNCGKCVKACPTGALEAPYRLNPFRCLSYVTQMRGSIPEEFRPLLGVRVFGCDTCQEACPKNKSVRIPFHEEFVPDVPLERRLIRLINIGSREFEKMFKPTPIGWRGKNVLRRNAVVALSNAGSGHKKCFEKLLEDPSPVIREHALWALKR
ncbi:tRNA epoxyqueuosine(34) reductase QueG [Thermosediminibacter litoriperuensis]|uniref:tRNA epoxyqueuosine(34) reductase QueG n=1 Tax=Thermosediminibacter litoriperuensis TaxID=291989 RepID=UPI0011E7AF86|nr:tRNA epoxyqueuosine(34) reductase QueG [Thermosediminibacter litoriperuensis]